MSTSLPSKEIFAVDVPEVKNFQLQFKYNFFVPDEKVREVSGIPANLLRKSTGEIEADQIKHLETRVPRHVIFNWSKVHINSYWLSMGITPSFGHYNNVNNRLMSKNEALQG